MNEQRSGWHLVLTIVTWILFLMSVLSTIVVTAFEVSFAYEATCTDVAPTEYRLNIMYIALGLYSLLIIPAFILLIRRKTVGTVIALILVCVAAPIPVAGTLLMLFSAAMC